MTAIGTNEEAPPPPPAHETMRANNTDAGREQENLFQIHYDSDDDDDDDEEDEDEDYVDVTASVVSSSLDSKAQAASELVHSLCTALQSFTPLPPKYVGHSLTVNFAPIGGVGVNSLARALIEQQRRYLALTTQIADTPHSATADAHTASEHAAATKHLVHTVEFGLNGVGSTSASSSSGSPPPAGAATLKDLKPLLRSARSLTSLSIWGQHLSASSLRPLARGLSGSALQSLSLANNELDDACGGVLAESLQRGATLTRLDLSGNMMSDAGAMPLLAAAARANRLVHLNLAQNQLSDLCTPQVAAYLRAPTCALETLDLSSNLLGDAGVVALCESLRDNVRLVQLHVRGHGLATSDGGGRQAAQRAREHTARHHPTIVRVITVEDEDEDASPPTTTQSAALPTLHAPVGASSLLPALATATVVAPALPTAGDLRLEEEEIDFDAIDLEDMIAITPDDENDDATLDLSDL